MRAIRKASFVSSDVSDPVETIKDQIQALSRRLEQNDISLLSQVLEGDELIQALVLYLKKNSQLNSEVIFSELAKSYFNLARQLQEKFYGHPTKLYQSLLERAYLYFQNALYAVPTQKTGFLEKLTGRQRSSSKTTDSTTLVKIDDSEASSSRSRAQSIGGASAWENIFQFLDDILVLQEKSLKPRIWSDPDNKNDAVIKGDWFWKEAYQYRAQAAYQRLFSRQKGDALIFVEKDIDFLLTTAIKAKEYNLDFDSLFFLIQYLKELKAKGLKDFFLSSIREKLFKIPEENKTTVVIRYPATFSLEKVKHVLQEIAPPSAVWEGVYYMTLRFFNETDQRAWCKAVVSQIATDKHLSEDMRNRQAFRVISLLNEKYIQAASLFKGNSLSLLGFPEDPGLQDLCQSLNEKPSPEGFDNFCGNFLNRLKEIPKEKVKKYVTEILDSVMDSAIALLVSKGFFSTNRDKESIGNGAVVGAPVDKPDSNQNPVEAAPVGRRRAGTVRDSIAFDDKGALRK